MDPTVEVCLFSYSGVHPLTLDCLIRELFLAYRQEVTTTFQQVFEDALISRSRSIALSRFLAGPASVLVMLDHDIQWKEGDAIGLAKKAFGTKGCVAGFYPKRAIGLGYSGRLKEDLTSVQGGADKLYLAEYLPAGFLAISKEAAMKVRDLRGEFEPQECVGADGVGHFDAFFMPLVVPSTLKKGEHEYLSEDWAFSARCTAAGVPLHFWAKPLLKHWGEYGFTMREAVKP